MDINSINPLQAMFDSYIKEAEKERAKTQMTLGDLIQRLQQLPEDAKIYFTEPHSYRGYYSDLAFEPTQEAISPQEALNCVIPCVVLFLKDTRVGIFLCTIMFLFGLHTMAVLV